MFIGKKSFNSKLKTKIFISYIIMLLFTINIKIIERQLIIFKLMNEQEILGSLAYRKITYGIQTEAIHDFFEHRKTSFPTTLLIY